MFKVLILSIFFIAMPFKKCQAKTLHIAIIDSGIRVVPNEDIKFCDKGHMDFTYTGIEDHMDHGTNVAYTIASYLKNVDYCFIIIKVFDKKTKDIGIDPMHLAFFYLLELKTKIDIINISAGGIGKEVEEDALVGGLIAKGIKVIAAAGNEHLDLDKDCKMFPACYKGVISVGNLDHDGKKQASSNYGKIVSVWEYGTDVCHAGICMTGTSQATAIHTGKFARDLKKTVDKFKN